MSDNIIIVNATIDCKFSIDDTDSSYEYSTTTPLIVRIKDCSELHPRTSLAVKINGVPSSQIVDVPNYDITYFDELPQRYGNAIKAFKTAFEAPLK